jgi:hypothetical protein
MTESQEPLAAAANGADAGRAEPRSLTLTDCLAMVAGFGVAIAYRQIPPMPPPTMGIAIPVWLIVAWWSLGVLLATALATAFVVVERQFMFRRPARPAEWVAILLGILIFREALPDLDDLVNRWLPPEWPTQSFSTSRGIVGAIGAVVFLVGLAVLGLMRRVLPHALKTIVLVASILGLLWGPIRVFSMEVHWLIPSPPIEPTSPAILWVWLEIRKYLGLLPLGLLFGIPAMATLKDWRARESKGRLWTEWPGPAIGLVLCLFWLVSLYLLRSESPPHDLNAERVVVPFWIAGVWWLSRWITDRFGDRWRRWLTPADCGV